MRTGADLAVIRERKPLVHQITNYVVMNETANATLALGALPVMAHAIEEVEELASVAGALVLNIGTLSEDWIEAMLLAAAAANRGDVPVVLDPVGAGATRLRTDTAKRILGEAEIAVTDTGIGIKAEDLPIVWQEFRQLDTAISRKYEGTGLGLALTRRLLALMDGRIWLESEPGIGTTFFFTLPIANEGA